MFWHSHTWFDSHLHRSVKIHESAVIPLLHQAHTKRREIEFVPQGFDDLPEESPHRPDVIILVYQERLEGRGKHLPREMQRWWIRSIMDKLNTLSPLHGKSQLLILKPAIIITWHMLEWRGGFFLSFLTSPLSYDTMQTKRGNLSW